MTPLVLRFDSDGTGHCLYTESIDLAVLGTLVLTRASTIEFDQPSQQWEVRDQQGALRFHDPSRARCLDWELQHFNQ